MQTRTRISLFILLILGLHAIPVLWYQGERQTRWPFLAWAMYARSFPPGPPVLVCPTSVAPRWPSVRYGRRQGARPHGARRPTDDRDPDQGLAITSDERDLGRRTVRQAGKVGGRRPG